MDNECPICHFTPLKVVTSWTPRNPGRRFNCCANIVSFDILLSFNFGLLDYDLIDKCSLVVGLSPGVSKICSDHTWLVAKNEQPARYSDKTIESSSKIEDDVGSQLGLVCCLLS